MTTQETPASSVASELERLIALRAQGVLSDVEFEQAKKLTMATATTQKPSQPLAQESHAATEPVLPENEPGIAAPVEPTKRARMSADQVIGYSNKYSTALMLGSLISGIGWLVVIGGIIGTIPVMRSAGIAGLAVLGVSILGIVAVASGQLIGAAVDVANNSAGTLALEKARWDEENG